MVEPKLDAQADSICIVFPIPETVQGVPDIPGNGEPHVTALYVGPGPREDACRIADLVDGELEAFIGEPFALSELGHFDNDDFTVAHTKVLVTPCTVEARRRVVEGVETLGLEPKHHPGPWRPHATLAYQEPGTRYEGVVPTGSWVCEGAEVWRGDERFVLGARGDKLARRGGKWLVLNAAGDQVLAEYETEGEARERLRQIEAAKAARDDGVDLEIELRTDARSDEEKAEIRKRWQDEGPNMGPAKLERWLESPFAGPNRKTGDARTRARRVASRALRLMKKSTSEWTDRDYSGALQVLAFIARMREVEPGDPLVVDGREGPSRQRAALMDWGFDPKADQASIEDRTDAGGAPAVITLPKTMIEVERQDACEVVGVHCYDRNGREIKLEDLVRTDGDDLIMKPEVHPDGWVEFTVFYSRAGNVQPYGDVLEYRPPEEVFAPRSLASGRGNPWELRHSTKLLTPMTVLGVARGCMRTFDRHPDGEHTYGRARAWDIGLINAIAGPAPEVSLAWRGLVDRRSGVTRDGERYDQIAREIVINSLASEPKGRAGPSVRVYKDSAGGAEVVTSAARMLELAASGPSATVYYDRRDWMMYDAAVSYGVTLNRDLPVVAGEWDAGAAAQRIFADATNAAGEFDAAKAAEAFMVADPSTGKKGDMHLPVVDIRDGRKVIVKNALDAVRSRLGQEGVLDEVPADVRKRADELAGALIDEYNAKQKKQDAMPMIEMLTKLIEARGLTPAAVAAELGVAGTSDLEQVFYSDDEAMQSKLIGMLVGAPAPAAQDMEMGEDDEKKKQMAELMSMMGEGDKMDAAMREKARAMFDAMMPGGEEGDMPKMVEVKIGDKDFMVPAEVQAEIESLRKRVEANGERADRAETSLAEAKKTSIPRQDAEEMMLSHGLVVGDVIELARRSYGPEFCPEPRKDCEVPVIITPREEHQDAADAPQPTLADWQRAALCGAFGDEKGAKEYATILAAPEAARGHLMKMRLDDAKSVLDERAHKSGEVKESIRRMRERNADDKAAEAARQDGSDDDLAAAIDKQQEVASARRSPVT